MDTWCEGPTHWKRPWCWESLKVGGEMRWDVWMASPTWWTWVWVSSRSWWWTERPGMLHSMGSQRVGHDWATEMNWSEVMHKTVPNAIVWHRIMVIMIANMDLDHKLSSLIWLKHALHKKVQELWIPGPKWGPLNEVPQINTPLVVEMATRPRLVHSVLEYSQTLGF